MGKREGGEEGMKLNVIIQDTQGNEIDVKSIRVHSRTSIVVKLLKHVNESAMNSIHGAIAAGLQAGCLIVPDWAELTFVEIK